MKKLSNTPPQAPPKVSASPACYADGEEVWTKWDYGDHWLINNARFGIQIPKYAGDEIAGKIYHALRTIWVDRDA